MSPNLWARQAFQEIGQLKQQGRVAR
jgi:hypothetical protein